MKRLAIMRHAKSSWAGEGLDDVDRPLSARGWRAGRRMGRELAQRGIGFDLVLASPAARVRETIDAVKEELELSAPVRFDPRLYLADEAQLRAILGMLPETVQRPLLVGHNPALQMLLLSLTGEGPGRLRDKVEKKFPTGAFAVVELKSERWEAVVPGCGTLVELILPKALD